MPETEQAWIGDPNDMAPNSCRFPRQRPLQVPRLLVATDDAVHGLGIPSLTGRLFRLDPLRVDHAVGLLHTVANPEVWERKLAPTAELKPRCAWS